MAEALLTLRDVIVRYRHRTLVDIPRLDVMAGEVLGILGPNGAGKTTLLRVLGLLLRPARGEVFFLGQAVMPSNALALRRRTASVFQEPLLLNTTVYDNVALGLKLRGIRGPAAEGRVLPWLERLGIADLRDRRARELSGGEAQRASLARAFVLDPDVLLLDEPFSSLDQPSREALIDDLRGIFNLTSLTAVFVTHERQEALAISNRLGVMSGGKLLQLGGTDEVFRHPKDEVVAKMVGRQPSCSAAGLAEGEARLKQL